MLYTNRKPIKDANNCYDGTGTAVYMGEAVGDGVVGISFYLEGTTIATDARIWLNNGGDQNYGKNNRILYVQPLPANTRKKDDSGIFVGGNEGIKVRKGQCIYVTLQNALAEPVLIAATFDLE